MRISNSHRSRLNSVYKKVGRESGPVSRSIGTPISIVLSVALKAPFLRLSFLRGCTAICLALVLALTASAQDAAFFLPQVVFGGEYSTQITLTNPGATVQSGTLVFV